MIPTNHLTRSAKYFAILAVTLTILGSSLDFASRIEAASLTVTTVEDELNEDGDCSLREAIIAANTDTAIDACIAGNDADTIQLGADTYELTLTGNDENAAATGDLDITDDLTIQGQSAETTIIDANSIDRVIDIRGVPNVALSGVTIRDGSAEGGGGIFNQDGTLTLSDVIVFFNLASSGGGVFNANGTIYIQNTEIVSNGGDDAAGFINRGSAFIENSEVTGNSGFAGGGIQNDGTLTINNSSISGNTSAVTYGGIHNTRTGNLTVTNSTIRGNSSESGTGILNEGTTTISDTIIQDNEAAGGASGAEDAIGSGIYNLGTMTVYGSTISGNR
ncbi:MAG: CSLREA domain-containing protein [Chloroflexota bacterium]